MIAVRAGGPPAGSPPTRFVDRVPHPDTAVVRLKAVTDVKALVVFLFEIGGGPVGKYTRLGDFLRAQRGKEVPMTFAEIERVIGGKLPPNSPQYPAWWSNNPSNNVMTKVWLSAGFRTERVDVKARKIVFRRAENSLAEASPPPPRQRGGRHPLFGALKGLVRVPPGVHLTEPADPDWGKVYE